MCYLDLFYIAGNIDAPVYGNDYGCLLDEGALNFLGVENVEQLKLKASDFGNY